MNDILYFLELAVIGIVIFLQFKIFRSVLEKIKTFRKVLPESSQLSIQSVFLTNDEIKEISLNDILENESSYSNEIRTLSPDSEKYYSEDEFINNKINEYEILGYTLSQSQKKAQEDWNKKQSSYQHFNKISFISFKEFTLEDLSAKIRDAINKYLLRNKGSVADFNLIRDIVDRYINTLDEEINITMSTPLYLGLMGTFIGIVLGLFNISFLDTTSFTGNGSAISVLLGGVKVAMIASFVGLGLTILNSAWFYKEAKSICETNKNDLYTFIQTELLPILNLEDATNLITLQRNIEKFSSEFSANILKLQAQTTRNFDAITAQRDVLIKLENIDVKKLTQANLTIFKELNSSVEKFEKFNKYLASVDSYLENSITLSDKISGLLERTDNFAALAEKIEKNVEISTDLQNFLKQNMSELELRKEYVDKVITTVDRSLQDGLEALSEHAKKDIANMDKIITESDILFTDTVKMIAEKLNSTEILDELKKMVCEIREKLPSQNDLLGNVLKDIDKELKRSRSNMPRLSPGSVGPDGVSLELIEILNKINETLGQLNMGRIGTGLYSNYPVHLPF